MEPTLYFNLELKDWAIVVSTILGPILAVQAQKAVEDFKEVRSRKIGLFETLMATRASRVSAEHVRALNMIDLVFYGERTLGKHRRSSKEEHILDAWKEYRHHLNNKLPDEPIQSWVATGATIAEVEFEMREAIVFHLEGLRADGLPVPVGASQVEYVEVTA